MHIYTYNKGGTKKTLLTKNSKMIKTKMRKEDDKQLSSRMWKSKTNRKQNEHLTRWIVRSRVSFLVSERWERQDGRRKSDMQEKKKKKRKVTL